MSGGAAAAEREEQGRGGAEQTAKSGHCSFLTLTTCGGHYNMIQLCAIKKQGQAHCLDTDQLEKLLIINSRGKIEKNQEKTTPEYQDS